MKKPSQFTWTEAQYQEYLKRTGQPEPTGESKGQKNQHENHCNQDNLGVVPSIMARGGSIKTPVWTQSEDRQLSVLYLQMRQGKIKQTEIAVVLKRSVAACACRAGELGISTPRGKWKRPEPNRKVEKAKITSAERSEITREWHKNNIHPMKGKPVPQNVRDAISKANDGRKVPPERTMRQLKTRLARFGTLANKNFRGSWKAGWREIGGKRIYARSRWEANYARYLEFLKKHNQLAEWEHEPETFWFEKIKRGCRSYLPDFRVTHIAGNIEYHEVKGWMDDRSKTKIRRMAKYHPAVTLIVRDSTWFKANRLRLRGLITGWEDGKV